MSHYDRALAKIKEETEGERYGWYSEKHAEHGGYASVALVGGGYANVTSVSKTSTDSGTKWPDVVCVGKITGRLTPVYEGIMRKENIIRKIEKKKIFLTEETLEAFVKEEKEGKFHYHLPDVVPSVKTLLGPGFKPIEDERSS